MTNTEGLRIISAVVKLPEDIREYFRKQGKIGAAKRMVVLTPEQRREIARNAVRQRWARAKQRAKAKKRR